MCPGSSQGLAHAIACESQRLDCGRRPCSTTQMRACSGGIFVALALLGAACGGQRSEPPEREVPNPQLVAPAPIQPASGEAPLPEPPGSPVAQEPECELRQIERALDDHCGMCHLFQGFYVPVDCLGDCTQHPVRFEELIDRGLVAPGDAEGSKLLRRI